MTDRPTHTSREHGRTPWAEPPVTGLRCLRCGRALGFSLEAYTCPACATVGGADPGVLDVEYDYEAAAARGDFPGSGYVAPGDLPGPGPLTRPFRWRALLPVGPGPTPLLPVGATPLVPAPRLARHYGLSALWLKDETRNPTRSLKDRATAIALTLAARLGRETLFCASAGNAAISLAGFCAHAGLRAVVWVPAASSPVRLDWLRRYGAEIRASAGDYDEAFAESEAEGQHRGWYSRNCALNPFLVEGKKTAAFEVAEQLGWSVPDLVVAPVGDGCTLGALGKGFRELALLGRTAGVPRLMGVQSERWRPLVNRFGDAEAEGAGRPAAGSERIGRAPAPNADPAAPDPEPVAATPRPDPAASIAVGHPRNALRVLREVRDSGGTFLAVSDEEILAAGARLAREAGVVVEPTSATTLAALERLASSGSLEGRSAVLVLTGGRADS